MLQSILFKVSFASAKAGVKESAEYFAGALQATKRQLTKPGRSFEMSLFDQGIESWQFYPEWAKSAIQAYIERYPPKTPRQQSFLMDEIIPRAHSLRPSLIPDVIIKYGYSEFYGLCQTLESNGDNRGEGALLMLGNIIEDAFRSRGLEDVLKY